MGRPAALTPHQRDKVKKKLRSGATVDAAWVWAKEQGWKVGRAAIGTLAKGVSDEGPSARPVPRAGGDLAEQVQELQEQIAALRSRLESLLQLPKVTLGEAAAAAVAVATRISQDPDVDPRVRVQALAQLPELIEAARKAAEAEEPPDEEELFSA